MSKFTAETTNEFTQTDTRETLLTNEDSLLFLADFDVDDEDSGKE